MRSVFVDRRDGVGSLQVRESPEPTVEHEDVLVEVVAAGLNRADVLQRLYGPTGVSKSAMLGLEFAGSVVAIGAGVSRWRVGERVMGITAGGGHAEYIAIHQDVVCAVPEGMNWLQAAAIPEAYITAYDALHNLTCLQPNQTVLINAIGSSVGIALMQVTLCASAHPFGTTRSRWKLERALELGLTDGCTPEEDDLVPRRFVDSCTGGRGFDVIVDLVGGPYVKQHVSMLSPGGCLVVLGTLAGVDACLSLRDLLINRLTVKGSILRSRTMAEKARLTEALAQYVLPKLSSNGMAAPIDSTYELEDIANAHIRLESNTTFGKIVLRMKPESLEGRLYGISA